MAWSNPILLLGTLLVAAPIVLHLMMRQRPKRMEFPAIRFVRARQESSRRRLRLRHWLLLLLRCLAIALIAAALARPSVSSASASRWAVAGLLAAAAAGLGLLAVRSSASGQGVWMTRGMGIAAAVLGLASLIAGGAATAGADTMIGDQEAPVAAALVFDVSPRMEYQHANLTRIEQARQLAYRLIRELPPDSQVAVLDSRRQGAYWSVDRGAARNAVERLEITGTPQPLPEVLRDAVALCESSPLERREVYVFSDLAESAWDAAGAAALARRLEQPAAPMLYVFDVGVESASNVGLGDLELSANTMPRDGQLRIKTELRSTGVAGPRSVRLELEDLAPGLPVIQDGETKLPESVVRDRRDVELSADQAQSVEFELRIADPGTRHGRVLVEGSDSLGFDDVRHFTVEVREAWPLLLATGPNASAEFMTAALAPAQYQDFDCQVVAQDQLATADLPRFGAVCLLDPSPLDEAMWERLEQYVRGGGALWIQLGRNARSDTSFNGETAQRLLAGPLMRVWRAAGRELFIDVRDRSHPALALLRDETASIPWPALPVFKHWVIGPLVDNARVLAGYSANTHPAIVQRPVGEGVVVVSSTPLSDVVYTDKAWNELAYGEDNWPPFLLCNELLLYLVRGADARLNYFTGETVELDNDERELPRRYQLFLPDEPPQDVTSRDSLLQMPYTVSSGTYRLKGSRGGVIVRGFSCNLPARFSQLQRLSPARLEELLGKGRYQLASDYDQLQRVQDRQRVGREFFSILMLLLAGVLALEHVLASRFYKPAGRGADKPVDSGQEAAA